jgi:uncharacterized membrane protein YeaQ/YmgE (transglycosylase-associated protein family)
MNILVAVLIGAVAGWLAGNIMNSKKGGVLYNIILGILGGFFGNWVFSALNLYAESNWLGTLVTSTVGAVLLIVLSRILFKSKAKKK